MVDETRWCWPRHEVEMGETKSSYVVMSVEEDAPRCRICLSEEGDVVESPCACMGTQRWVHDTCLVRCTIETGGVPRGAHGPPPGLLLPTTVETLPTGLLDFLSLTPTDFLERTEQALSVCLGQRRDHRTTRAPFAFV